MRLPAILLSLLPTLALAEQQRQAPLVSTMAPQILADVLPLTKTINIFAGLTRDVNTVTARLSSSGANTTLLAPSNAAMAALPRKPWEDPEVDASAFTGEDGERRAYENLARFVEAHVVPASPWDGEKVKTLGGGEVWFVEEGGQRYIMPGRVEVGQVAGQVGNGEVWVLKGALNYA